MDAGFVGIAICRASSFNDGSTIVFLTADLQINFHRWRVSLFGSFFLEALFLEGFARGVSIVESAIFLMGLLLVTVF